ncbi:hypothetical protein B1806_14540 [Metallibacterium scheffleri]|uniref:Uncharacterized protein n=2 Tax=Metallibacterium scheffleri TaxID=993689 RepID=A0A4S3KGZ1_9GAMM|nr:hypothetical protein B1806_14540 [Metallibacterium scheffleri]
MCPQPPSEPISRAAAIEAQLMRDDGALLSGERLRRALGYRSIDALRQAIVRGTIPVPVFTLPHRRGRFALARDVAAWLAAQGPAPHSLSITPSASAREEETM